LQALSLPPGGEGVCCADTNEKSMKKCQGFFSKLPDGVKVEYLSLLHGGEIHIVPVSEKINIKDLKISNASESFNDSTRLRGKGGYVARRKKDVV